MHPTHALSGFLEQDPVIRLLASYGLLLACNEDADELRWHHDDSNGGDGWSPFAFNGENQIGEWVPPGTFISKLPQVLSDSFDFFDNQANWNLALGIAHGTIHLVVSPSLNDMKALRMRWTRPLPKFAAKALLQTWHADPQLCDFSHE